MYRFLFTLGLGLLTFVALPAGAAMVEIKQTHRGLTLVAFAPSTDRRFDIELADGPTAIGRIKQAIDLLYEKSPFSARALETLRGAGEVIIAYDPHFPEAQLTTLKIAGFFPDFYQRDGPRKQFVTRVGRYGAKWPARELAAVLAHELVGHGMQHYRGRLEHVRTVDLECEAYLYEEVVYQDLGFDKSSSEMVNYRKVLEDHWCRAFRADARRHDPESLSHWERLNPNVPGILAAYLKYIERLRRSGAARKSIEAERRTGQRR